MCHSGMGDYGRWPHELDQVSWVSAVSFHSYNGNQTDMRSNIQWLRDKIKASNKTLAFASEISNRPWDPVCGDLAVLREERLGWFVWELMQSESGWASPRCTGCPSYQGNTKSPKKSLVTQTCTHKAQTYMYQTADTHVVV